MNGEGTNHASGPNHHPNGTNIQLPKILEALSVIHDPRSTNEARKEATVFLDEAKADQQAPSHGVTLARDRSQASVVRHFGLSLVEYPVKYRWDELSEDESSALRQWIVELAQSADDSEPAFLRNKIAQIWVDLAKRCWIDEWPSMDSQLVELWHKSFAQKDIVLHVLETLSDEVFSKEDSLASLQGGALGKACVEIFTPVAILSHEFPSRQPMTEVRHGDEGWLQRLVELLDSCLTESNLQNKQILSCAVKALVVFRSVLLWITPKAIHATQCVRIFCKCLEIPNTALRMACVEAMHALYHRPNLEDADIAYLVRPMLVPEKLNLLYQTFQASAVDVEDIDDVKYITLKKLSEMLCALGTFVELRPQLVADEGDLANLLDLLLIILRNPSLVVSIPVLYVWTRLLGSRPIGKSQLMTRYMSPLLELCSQRLVRYELVAADSTDPTILFLLEDVETVPERHAFIGNYRRYCMVIVELIVRKSSFEAMRHILTQADTMLKSLYDGTSGFSIDTFASNSKAILEMDAQLTVVMTALKGYLKWLRTHPARDSNEETQHKALQDSLYQWCTGLLNTNYQDPIIRKRILQLCVEVSLTALESKQQFAIAICQNILTMDIVDNSSLAHYHEAVKDLRSTAAKELQKLAIRFCNEIFPLYSDFESEIQRIAARKDSETRLKLDHQAFLFIVVQRVSPTLISEPDRMSRLTNMVQSSVTPWQDPALRQSLSSLEAFIQLLGLDKLPQYFLSRNAQSLDDWSTFSLDQEGLDLQQQVSARSDQLPLQAIKSFLGVSTDRVSREGRDLEVASSLWAEPMSIMLPSLLNFISNAHAFQNPTEWNQFPDAMKDIINRILMDRVWQAGISNESRDDFYTRVRTSKTSLEGLASTVRSSVRHVRETSYWILHCLSQLGDAFYGHADLPQPLAEALYDNCHVLSAHQLSGLLKLSGALIENCTRNLRSQFLPHMLVKLFTKLDIKITADWKAIDERKHRITEDDNLDLEMKAESILRQLTHSAIVLISSLLTSEEINGHGEYDEGSTRTLILASPSLLEPLVLFCTHALRMQDSRCCGIVTRVLRSLVPEFCNDTETAAQVREFFSTEVLRACITSLHEPYFADLQKDLAALIGVIVKLYLPKTATPREVLLSLPGMDTKRTDGYLQHLSQATTDRHVRSYVLTMLDDVRGVSIAEQGKINPGSSSHRKHRTAMQDRFMTVDEAPAAKRGDSPDLAGVADLFG